MIVKLLTEYHLEFLSLKGGCPDLSESTNVKMPHCWKSQALAHIVLFHTCGISIGDVRTSASSGVSFCVSLGTVDITCTDNLCLFGASCDIVS